MTIQFTCTCGKVLQVAEKFAGQSAKCPGCGTTLRVPVEDGSVTAHAPPPQPRAATEPAKTAPWEKPKARAKPPPLPDEDDDPIAELLTHAGKPIDEDDDFFVEAPAAIGAVVSAFSTLRKGQTPRPFALRALVGILVCGFSCVVMAAFVAVLRMPLRFIADDVAFILVIPGLISLLFGACGFWYMRFNHSCTFVGTKGIAWYQCAGSRARLARTDVFLFKNAADLRTSQTRHYVNGGYTGTHYTYTWSTDKGKAIYTLTGSYRSEAGTPKVSDPFYFALAAEAAWSQCLLKNIDRLTDDDNLVYFALTRGNYIQLGDGLFILKQGNNTIELEADDIEQVSVDNGIVSIKEVGGKKGWFATKGVHQFAYQDLGNAQFFSFAMDKMLGIRF
jgi:hypothetical protein